MTSMSKKTLRGRDLVNALYSLLLVGGLVGVFFNPFLAGAVLVWITGWWLNTQIAAAPIGARPLGRAALPVIFGATVLVMWELIVRGLDVSPVILPAPSAVAAKFALETAVLWGDFVQTVLKGAMSGFVIGCVAAFGVALAISYVVSMLMQ